MARRRRNGNKMKGLLKGGGGISRRIFPVVKTLSAPIAFLEQITAKDRQDLGRLAGITPFHRLSDGTMLPTAPQTINPAGVMNKWTNAGLIGLGYKIIGSQINKATGMSLIPETAKIGSIGKSVFIGGALGGFFDDSPTKSHTFTRQSFPTTNRAMVNTNYNSGSDSTGSSF